jgi:hypothetical protein
MSTATSQPTLDTLPDMHNVAAIIAQDARENQAGVEVISVGPVYGEQADHVLQYSVMVIVPGRDADNFAATHIMLGDAEALPIRSIAYSRCEVTHIRTRQANDRMVMQAKHFG